MKNTHGEVSIFSKVQAKACNFTKINTPQWVFFTFFKLYNWHQMAQRITYKSFLNIYSSLHSPGFMFGLETVCFFNHSVTVVISIILGKVCFPANSFNNTFSFVN